MAWLLQFKLRLPSILAKVPHQEGNNAASARSAFLTGLTGVGNESFETFAVGTTTPLTANVFGCEYEYEYEYGLTHDWCKFGFTGRVSDSTDFEGTDIGRWATSGTKFFESIVNFSIALASPVSAFGFYGTDIGDRNDQLWIDLTDTGGTKTSYKVDHSFG